MKGHSFTLVGMVGLFIVSIRFPNLRRVRSTFLYLTKNTKNHQKSIIKTIRVHLIPTAREIPILQLLRSPKTMKGHSFTLVGMVGLFIVYSSFPES